MKCEICNTFYMVRRIKKNEMGVVIKKSFELLQNFIRRLPRWEANTGLFVCMTPLQLLKKPKRMGSNPATVQGFKS
jgi:hypothetical protein